LPLVSYHKSVYIFLIYYLEIIYNMSSSISAAGGGGNNSSRIMSPEELSAEWKRIQDSGNPYIPLDLMQSTFREFIQINGSGQMELKNGVENNMRDNEGYQAALRAMKIVISYNNKPINETTNTLERNSRLSPRSSLSNTVPGQDIQGTNMNSLIVHDAENSDILASTAKNCLNRLKDIDDNIARINASMLNTLQGGSSSSANDVKSLKEQRVDAQVKRQLIETLLEVTWATQARQSRDSNTELRVGITRQANDVRTKNRTLKENKMLELELRLSFYANFYTEAEFNHVMGSVMNGLTSAENRVDALRQAGAWFKNTRDILTAISEENGRLAAELSVGTGTFASLSGLVIPAIPGGSGAVQRAAELGLWTQGPLTEPTLIYKALSLGQQIIAGMWNVATAPARLVQAVVSYAPNTCLFLGAAGAIWHLALNEVDRAALRSIASRGADAGMRIASRGADVGMRGANAVYNINSEFRDYLISRGFRELTEDMVDDLVSIASSSRASNAGNNSIAPDTIEGNNSMAAARMTSSNAGNNSITRDTIAGNNSLAVDTITASIAGDTKASQSIAASIARSTDSKASKLVSDLEEAAAAGDVNKFLGIIQSNEASLGQRGAIDTALTADALLAQEQILSNSAVPTEVTMDEDDGNVSDLSQPSQGFSQDSQNSLGKRSFPYMRIPTSPTSSIEKKHKPMEANGAPTEGEEEILINSDDEDKNIGGRRKSRRRRSRSTKRRMATRRRGTRKRQRRYTKRRRGLRRR
jgi:hypothetical protein